MTFSANLCVSKILPMFKSDSLPRWSWRIPFYVLKKLINICFMFSQVINTWSSIGICFFSCKSITLQSLGIEIKPFQVVWYAGSCVCDVSSNPVSLGEGNTTSEVWNAFVIQVAFVGMELEKGNFEATLYNCIDLKIRVARRPLVIDSLSDSSTKLIQRFFHAFIHFLQLHAQM